MGGGVYTKRPGAGFIGVHRDGVGGRGGGGCWGADWYHWTLPSDC